MADYGVSKPEINLEKLMVKFEFLYYVGEVKHQNGFQRWVSNKQMSKEGGFQGRSNKLVDACYSYWQGAICPLLQLAFKKLG